MSAGTAPISIDLNDKRDLRLVMKSITHNWPIHPDTWEQIRVQIVPAINAAMARGDFRHGLRLANLCAAVERRNMVERDGAFKDMEWRHETGRRGVPRRKRQWMKREAERIAAHKSRIQSGAIA